MQTWTTNENKAAEWGEGPWVDEPDKIQWTDEATGLPCMIHRGPVGSLCGYVGVPPEHPLHGKGCEAPHVDVHGGLTYANRCMEGDDPATGICHVPGPGEPEDVWWFGFDCAHLMYDIAPAMAVRERVMELPPFPSSPLYPTPTYKDVAYVTHEVTILAAQLAAVTQGEQQ